MKKNILKYNLLTAITIVVFTSCVGEDDYVIPDYKDKVIITTDSPFIENFESYDPGSGSNELAVNSGGWTNVNIGTGNRVWHVRQFSNNKFAEFDSFYSNNSHVDNTWLITPKLELGDASYAFSFATEVRFFTNDNLSVFVSTDYDGTTNGISTAEWEPLDAFISGAAQDGNNTFTSSGVIDLDEYRNSVIRIGFRYTGNKAAGETSTYRVDNITIFEIN